jgi:hypothetical protein
MGLSRSVAGLAADVHFGPRAGIALRNRVIVLGVIGGMTLCALRVPVLETSGPVKRIAGPNPFVGIKVKPALALDVPGKAQGLQPATLELDEILLKGCYSDGEYDLELD